VDDEPEQDALFYIEGPNEDGCVWIHGPRSRHPWTQNLGPRQKVADYQNGSGQSITKRTAKRA
jgi:hypothetical protein